MTPPAAHATLVQARPRDAGWAELRARRANEEVPGGAGRLPKAAREPREAGRVRRAAQPASRGRARADPGAHRLRPALAKAVGVGFSTTVVLAVAVPPQASSICTDHRPGVFTNWLPLLEGVPVTLFGSVHV